MTIHVDDVRHAYGTMIMCHMWSESREDLLTMADRIGVARKWIQEPPKVSWLHFDICLKKKALALAAGAILTDKYGPVMHVAKLKGDMGKVERIRQMRLRAGFDAETGMIPLGPLFTGAEHV